MKSKQDIFDENDLIFYYPDGGMVESKASKVFNAVDEYSEGVSIEFAIFTKRYNSLLNKKDMWSAFSETLGHSVYTTKELFELFKKENNL